MIAEVYCVKDELQNEFLTPVYAKDEKLAIRDFKYKINSIEQWKYNSADYSLFKLGTFDTETGVYTTNIEKICGGRSVLDDNLHTSTEA